MLQPRIAALMMCVALTTLSTPASAQPATGTITGTVTDANGAPLVRAAVTITNQQTRGARTVRTVDTGAFVAVEVPPGVYTVSVDAPGFLKVTRADQKLEAGATLTVDLMLEVRLSEEITVTAQKRDETVYSTPFSIAAPTEEVLRERGIQNFEELADNTANVFVQNLGPGQSQVSIRGVSSGQIARDQPGPKEEVGTYLDESPISFLLFTPNIDFFDMNRVEVLRGPQGTLFGSGSLSGTVRYISNQPQLGQTHYFGEVEGVSVSGGNQGGNIKGGVNFPVSNTSAVRVAAYADGFAGYMDAVQPDLSVDKNVNTGNRFGVRAAVLIAPDDLLTITPRFVYQKVKTNGWNRIDIYNILGNPYTTTRPAVTLGDRQLYTQIQEPMTDNFYLGDLNINYKLGDVTLTSVTTYAYRDLLVTRDAGALTSSITGGSIGLPEDVYTLNAPLNDATTAQGWTQEVRVSGGKGPLSWLGGAYYSTSKKAYGQNLDVAGFTQLSGIPTASVYAPEDVLFYSSLDYNTNQYAFFGEGNYAFNDWFTLTAGLRYYNWKDNKKQVFDGIFGEDASGQPQLTSGSTTADGVAPRVIASFKLSDSTNLNAQASKGFRLGGLNDPLNVNLCTENDLATFGGQEGFSDETAWNYELGTKSRLFGGRSSLNVSAFYIDISNLQTVVTAGSCSSRLVYTVPKSRSVGGEVEFSTVVSDHFDFSASAGYNDATLQSTVTSTDAGGNTVVVSGIQTGARLPSVPQWQAALAATYQQQLAQGYVGYLTGTWQYIGSRYTQVGDDVPGFGVVPLLPTNGGLPNTIGGPLTQGTFTFDPLLPAYNILNFRLGVRFQSFDVAFFVNNVTDERAFLALDRERGLLARVGYLTNPPRTFGLTTRLDF